MILSNSAVCGSKRSRFFKEQEASGKLDSLARPLRCIPSVGHISVGHIGFQ